MYIVRPWSVEDVLFKITKLTETLKITVSALEGGGGPDGKSEHM